MRTLIATLLVLAACAAPAAAQSQSDLLISLGQMQQHLDRLQAARNAQLGDTGMRAYLDYSAAWASGQVYVQGWGFRCNGEPTSIDVVIDGAVVRAVGISRFPHQGVIDAFLPYCPAQGMPAQPGLTFMLDLVNYAPGAHTVQLRLWDERGAMEKSNILTVYW